MWGFTFLGPSDCGICWLEPEDQVALALKGAVVILEVTTGRTLHTPSRRENAEDCLFCRST
jgi:hypothetical protein